MSKKCIVPVIPLAELVIGPGGLISLAWIMGRSSLKNCGDSEFREIHTAEM